MTITTLRQSIVVKSKDQGIKQCTESTDRPIISQHYQVACVEALGHCTVCTLPCVVAAVTRKLCDLCVLQNKRSNDLWNLFLKMDSQGQLSINPGLRQSRTLRTQIIFNHLIM